MRSYDPYAGNDEKSGVAGASVAAESANNAYENMKGLLALARMTNGSKEGDGRGEWKGGGTLRSGFKDYGTLPEEKAAAAAGAASAMYMPDSTSSESSDEDEDDAAGSSRKRRADDDVLPKSVKKHKKEKSKKEKKHKSRKEKKSKSKKEKREKDKKKRRRSDSD